MTIFTDGVDPRHLFGGVGTALVIGALIAARMGGRLRLVTRRTAPDAAAIGEILAAHAIDWSGPTDIAYMPLGDTTPLPVGAQDRVLATSWWTVRAALGSLPPDRILYLLQEDERLFYANGDERLCCTETLCAPELRALVNSELLFRHLADGPDALPGLRHRARWFNPAFPAFGTPHALSARAGRKNFFFYARPTNARNLYWRGLEVIDAALRRHILHPDEWNIHFVGADLVEMDLPGNLRPTLWSGLPWLQYAELVSRMDLGLCLMDTPHPSYPPLDLAAAGAVVVTNTSGPKTTLAGWSGNILAAPPTLDGLVEALRQAVELAQNLKLRSANWAADSIPRAWEPQLAPALDWLLPAGD